MIELIEVKTITATIEEGVYNIILVARVSGELVEGPFGYRPEDTSEMGALLTQWMIDNEGEFEILPYVEPAPFPYSLPVAMLWSRMTDDEAETFDEAMSTSSPLRLRKQFNTATSMMSDGELFGFVRNVMLGALDEPRLEVILAEPPIGHMSEIAPAA